MIAARLRLRMRFARAPIAHFLAIGAVGCALDAWLGGGSLVARALRVRAPDVRAAADVQGSSAATAGELDRSVGRATIVLTSGEVAALRDAWRRDSGRLPTPTEEAELIDRAIDDEVLFREALRLLAGRGAEPVHRRLVELARLLELGPLEDEPELVREARRLGFQENDPVIRRHLIETMRLALTRPSRGAELGGGDVESYLSAHPERFALPARVRLTQVYLSRDRHPRVDEDAALLLAQLDGEHVPPAQAIGLGDPFARGARFELSADALDRAFGPGFAARVASAPVGQWSGPIPSAYGLHVVWVHERLEPAPPPVGAVRGRAVHAMLADDADARLRDRLDALRRGYQVEVRSEAGDDGGLRTRSSRSSR